VMDGSNWFWEVLMMLLLGGGFVAIVVFAVGAFADRPRRRSDDSADAQAVLEDRFAKGEISQEEFEERKRALRSRAA
jgi:putative membrane protein